MSRDLLEGIGEYIALIDPPASELKVKQFHCTMEGGQRLLATLESDSLGTPVYVSLYISGRVWGSDSAHTQSRKCRDLHFFLLWCEENKIDIAKRMAEAEFLSEREIMDFADRAKQFKADAFSDTEGDDSDSNVSYLGNADFVQEEMKAQEAYAASINMVKAGTLNHRLWVASDYCEYLFSVLQGTRATAESVRRKGQMLFDFESEQVEDDSGKQHDPDRTLRIKKAKKALPEIEVLCANLLPSTETRLPWKNPAIRERNCLIIQMHTYTGLRISELCGLKIEDLDPQRSGVLVAYRVNDKDDRRMNPASNKTGKQHFKPLPDKLYRRLETFIVELRGEHSSPYIFLSTHLKPISKRTVQRIHEELGDVLGILLWPHDLRHVFSGSVLDAFIKGGMSRSEAEDGLRLLNGWSPTSRQPENYAKEEKTKHLYKTIRSIQSARYQDASDEAKFNLYY